MLQFLYSILILFCISCLIDISHEISNGFIVELIHDDSFKSPLYNPTQNKFQRTFKVVQPSINHINYFYKDFSATKNKF